MQDKLIEAAQHVVDEMERGYTIIGPVSRLKEALAAVRAHDAGTDEGLRLYPPASHAAESVSTAQLDAEDQHPKMRAALSKAQQESEKAGAESEER